MRDDFEIFSNCEEFPENPYELVAHGIILQAAEDYREALKTPKRESSKNTIKECERFFRGEWYRVLTNLDGETLIRMLREEAETESRNDR